MRKLFLAFKYIPDLVLTKIDNLQYDNTKNDIKNNRILLGKILSQQNRDKKIHSLSEVEFSIFSQWGDDGIIQYIVQHTDIPNKTFVEFGVENYRESNTRFLLIHDNWSGLVMDGSEKNIRFIKNDKVSWGYDLHAVEAFITAENINKMLQEYLDKGYNKEIGILSIDIDGNDYWIWKAITVVSPIIVIIEYNSLLGIEKPYTIPYNPKFQRFMADMRLQYYGTSLKAAYLLAKERGYSFIGCNSNGNNAYFIRNDKASFFKALTPQEGYVRSKFREFSINNERVSGDKRMSALDGKVVVNVESGQEERFQYHPENKK